MMKSIPRDAVSGYFNDEAKHRESMLANELKITLPLPRQYRAKS